MRKMKGLLYRDFPGGEWRWTIFASNGRVLADSGEGYKRKGDAMRAFAKVVYSGTNGIELKEAK